MGGAELGREEQDSESNPVSDSRAKGTEFSI